MEPQHLPQWPEVDPVSSPAAPGDHAGEWSPADGSGRASIAGPGKGS